MGLFEHLENAETPQNTSIASCTKFFFSRDSNVFAMGNLGVFVVGHFTVKAILTYHCFRSQSMDYQITGNMLC